MLTRLAWNDENAIRRYISWQIARSIRTNVTKRPLAIGPTWSSAIHKSPRSNDATAKFVLASAAVFFFFFFSLRVCRLCSRMCIRISRACMCCMCTCRMWHTRVTCVFMYVNVCNLSCKIRYLSHDLAVHHCDFCLRVFYSRRIRG